MKAKDLITLLQADPEAEVLLHDYYMGDFGENKNFIPQKLVSALKF